ncbi:MAG: hypothetical protein ABFD25_20905 [Clostridiaceae bacterium]
MLSERMGLTQANCAVTPPEIQLRDKADELAGLIEKANDFAESIEDKLFGGVSQSTNSGCSDKPCPPQNVRYGLDRSHIAIGNLLSRLDGINSRL